MTPDEILKAIDAVTADQIQELAQELFKESALNLAMIGPHKDEAEFQALLSL